MTEQTPMEQPLNERFTQAREDRRITLEEAAHALSLPVEQLEKFEGGDWEAQSLSAFERGYLRNYAQYLDVDISECEALFPESNQVGSTLKSVRRFDQYPTPAPLMGHIWRWFLTLIILALVVGLAWMVI